MTIETMARIEWPGGENPVREGDTLTRVWFRNGRSCEVRSDDEGELNWSHDLHSASDIIAYAVTPERKPETPAERPETMRDRVAMAALPAIIAAMQGGTIGHHPVAGGGPAGFVASAFDIADAFMAARGDV